MNLAKLAAISAISNWHLIANVGYVVVVVVVVVDFTDISDIKQYAFVKLLPYFRTKVLIKSSDFGSKIQTKGVRRSARKNTSWVITPLMIEGLYLDD